MLAVVENDAVEYAEPVNLDQVEKDLADVETALARLEAGTYWTCEVTGEELPDELLAQQPTARRLAH
jgi:RNA polymerase-binding transcription factor DksA